MNQPTNWGGLVAHTPGQIPRILNVDAVLHVNDRVLAILGKLKQRARVGGQARAAMFRARQEQAEKTARKIWAAASISSVVDIPVEIKVCLPSSAIVSSNFG